MNESITTGTHSIISRLGRIEERMDNNEVTVVWTVRAVNGVHGTLLRESNHDRRIADYNSQVRGKISALLPFCYFPSLTVLAFEERGKRTCQYGKHDA
jgi:hypothetical protein